ncbi:B-cell differentiation antigen CD72 [Pteronotus mesoamericanus]|uniref:B-cell differentiation antigen CD72 n=1 Tax=Pteronotus mesoamericanus TaxID=1884717 RepID=UPI0023EC9CA7|nr:B-cell differentiation antigen CD72 [Pteronotus parnellii mesoamericanus]
MAESVTYADLRFVKAPLKKRISCQLGQDPETDDDGELTYENVQVPSISGGASSLASSGRGDKAGLQSEPPTASWSSVTSPAARRLQGCRSSFSKYLLGLLFACLLLGIAAISLGVRYLQVSQQLQHMNRVLEATNSSLRQQLQIKITQLGQKEQDLLGSRRELTQSQEALRVEQRDCQAVKEQLQACQSDSQGTKEALHNEEERRRSLEERLNRIQDKLKPYLTCDTPASQDTCCPMGWILVERKCFYFSSVKKSWEESKKFCSSMLSSLATLSDYPYTGYHSSSVYKAWEQSGRSDSFWIDVRPKDRQGTYTKVGSGYNAPKQPCYKIPSYSWLSSQDCKSSLPFICEKEAFKYPDQH